MKFSITINQKQALELGLNNVNQVIILGLIADAHSWAEPEIIDNDVYYWASRQKISDELPLLGLKADSVYRHLKSLADLGFIDYKKVGKKDCVKLTKKGKSYYVGNISEFDENHYVGNKSEFCENSEINPSKFGNKSEKNSEIFPTYKNTNPIRATRDNNIAATNVATFFLNKILSYKPNFKKPTASSFEKWVSDIDKAMRLDGRTEQELMDCVNWIYSNEGSFWIANVQSAKKLREKFDTMESQMMKSKSKIGKSFLEPIDETGKTATDAYREFLRSGIKMEAIAC